MIDAVKLAISALQRVVMAHPAADEHSRDMYRTAIEAHLALVKALADATWPTDTHYSSTEFFLGGVRFSPGTYEIRRVDDEPAETEHPF